MDEEVKEAETPTPASRNQHGLRKTWAANPRGMLMVVERYLMRLP